MRRGVRCTYSQVGRIQGEVINAHLRLKTKVIRILLQLKFIHTLILDYKLYVVIDMQCTEGTFPN